MKKIGETVLLQGKEYVVSGFSKRSYQCGPNKLDRIEKGVPPTQNQNRTASDIGGVPSYLTRMVAMDDLFSKRHERGTAKFPETESELMSFFCRLSSDLSPENLSCDGECSVTETRRKYREIMQAWKFLEGKLGRKVTEDDTYAWYEKTKKENQL